MWTLTSRDTSKPNVVVIFGADAEIIGSNPSVLSGDLHELSTCDNVILTGNIDRHMQEVLDFIDRVKTLPDPPPIVVRFISMLSNQQCLVLQNVGVSALNYVLAPDASDSDLMSLHEFAGRNNHCGIPRVLTINKVVWEQYVFDCFDLRPWTLIRKTDRNSAVSEFGCGVRIYYDLSSREGLENAVNKD